MRQTTTAKTIMSILVLVATVFMMLFSAIYLEEHVQHDCTGADCPICSVMEQCANNLKTLGTAIIVACAGLFLFMALPEDEKPEVTYFFCNSLIFQKVRMNN